MTPLAGSYDLRLVALSVVIAILASGAALDLAGRVVAAGGTARRVWLGGGALAMGLGIWCMHYTGMLAFRLPVPVHYRVPTVAVSLLAAVLASAVALFVASRERLGALRLVIGSAIMGGGIATMHYTGMAAMTLQAALAWSAPLVTASVIIAVTVSGVALWLAFRHGHAAVGAWKWPKIGSAVVMGLAISFMHYTGMAAARFAANDAPLDLSGTVTVSSLGGGAIGLGSSSAARRARAIGGATTHPDRGAAGGPHRSADAARPAADLRELQADPERQRGLGASRIVCARTHARRVQSRDLSRLPHQTLRIAGRPR
jgi:NO-binding membrane sensor protein with MHYT domain